MLAILLRNNASEDSFTFNISSMAMFAYMLEAQRHPKTRLSLLTWMGHVRSSHGPIATWKTFPLPAARS